MGGNLARIVYVSYGNPALAGPDTPCPGGREGFDVHPSFGADAERLRQAVEFVSQRFLPGIKALALCEGARSCRDPAGDRMTFVDEHQQVFAAHGACARSQSDPEFDRACFSGSGETFESSPIKGATEPMTCGISASEFRPYASRARWIRTANDSYFTAMTYPEGLPALVQPADLHDAIWGIFAAVLWRRHPSHCRRPRRDGRCRAAGDARGSGPLRASRARERPAVASPHPVRFSFRPLRR